MSSTNNSVSDSKPVEIIRKHVLEEILKKPEGSIDDDTPLVSGGLMNSLSTLELVAFLEDTFDIDIPAHEIRVENLDTVARIAEVVAEKQGA